MEINQADRHTIKFCTGTRNVSFVRVLSPGGEVEFSQSGENVEEDNIIEFANNWIVRVSSAMVDEQGLLEVDLDFLGLMNFFELLAHFATMGC